jgi:hypothetical protein
MSFLAFVGMLALVLFIFKNGMRAIRLVFKVSRHLFDRAEEKIEHWIKG